MSNLQKGSKGGSKNHLNTKGVAQRGSQKFQEVNASDLRQVDLGRLHSCTGVRLGPRAESKPPAETA